MPDQRASAGQQIQHTYRLLGKNPNRTVQTPTPSTFPEGMESKGWISDVS